MTNAQRVWLERNRDWQVHRAGNAYARIGLLDDAGNFNAVATTHGQNSIQLLPGEILVGIPSRPSS